MYVAEIYVKNEPEENVQYISGKFKNWHIAKDNIRDKLLRVMETIIARLATRNSQYFCAMLTPRWECHFKWHDQDWTRDRYLK